MRGLATAVVLTLVLAACGGGGDDDAAPREGGDADTSTTSTTAPVTTTSTGEEPASDDATTTTRVASAAGGESAPAQQPPASGGPAPVAPGTYRYRQSGTTKAGAQQFPTPPEGKMVADAAGADGRQVHHRYVDPEGEPADTTMRYGTDGMFVLDTVMRQGGMEIRCTFDEPLPAPPWPPTVGAAFSGHADCGSFTTDVAGRITGTRAVTLDGKTYEAVVVESTITTHGQIESTGTQIDWFVPELRLSAHTESEAKGKFGTFEFESQSTSDLLSAVPAAG